MITLFRGRLFTTVAHDPQRPFVVATREGTATALGTAFSVRQDESSTEVEVAESRVEICTRNRADCVVLHPGDRARIEDATLTRLASTGAASTPTWSTGWLEVDDRPLPEVLSELNRYSAQPIRFEANELAEFRVTGSYPLRDPQRAVTAIARHLGLEIRQLPEGGVAVSRP
jgi:transmembrane sensor